MIKFCCRLIIFIVILLFIAVPAISLIYFEDSFSIFDDDSSNDTNCDIVGYKVIEGCNCNGTVFASDECFDDCNLSCKECYTGQIIIGNGDNTETITLDTFDFENNWDDWQNLDEIFDCFFNVDDKLGFEVDDDKKEVLIIAIILLSLCVIAIPIYIILEITKFALCSCC